MIGSELKNIWRLKSWNAFVTTRESLISGLSAFLSFWFFTTVFRSEVALKLELIVEEIECFADNYRAIISFRNQLIYPLIAFECIAHL
jgi:hypothetical protein